MKKITVLPALFTIFSLAASPVQADKIQACLDACHQAKMSTMRQAMEKGLDEKTVNASARREENMCRAKCKE